MRDIGQLKQDGKTVFLTRYWLCVGAPVIIGLLIGACAFAGPAALVIYGPLYVGLNWVLLQLRRGEATGLDALFTKGFSENFGRHVGGYLLVMLYTFLWSLLFIIPGIIKGLSYSMTTYILADEPDLSAQEALRRSQQMMMGHKGQLFLLQLSFIGWHFLSLFTFGLLEPLFIVPWINAATTEFYEDLRTEAYYGRRVTF